MSSERAPDMDIESQPVNASVEETRSIINSTEEEIDNIPDYKTCKNHRWKPWKCIVCWSVVLFIFGLLAILILFSKYFQYPPLPSPPKCATIIDTDMGFDDVIALSMVFAAQRKSAVDCVRAVTVTNGLAHVTNGTDNLSKLLTSLNSQPEIATGGSQPLDPAQLSFPSPWRQSADQLAGIAQISTASASLPAQQQNASSYIANMLITTNEPVTLLCLGPLTNIAEAFSLIAASQQGDLSSVLSRSIKEIVIMGGALQSAGNVPATNNLSEWNMYVDALAAQKVFTSLPTSVPIYLLGTDVSRSAPCDSVFVDKVSQLVSRASNAASAAVGTAINAYCGAHSDKLLFDPAAAGFYIINGVLNPQSTQFYTFSTPSIQIQTAAQTMGQTLVLPSGQESLGRIVHGATAMDTWSFQTLILSLIY